MNKVLINYWWNNLPLPAQKHYAHLHFCEGQADCVVNANLNKLKQKDLEILFEKFGKQNATLTEHEIIQFFNSNDLNFSNFTIYLEKYQINVAILDGTRTYSYSSIVKFLNTNTNAN